MGVPVFYCEGLAGDSLVLDGAEGRHAAVVRRIAAGEVVRLTNGKGSYAEGPVTAVSKTGLTVAVSVRADVPAPPLRLVVVQALPKGERAEVAVESLTEVGADLIVPWNASRSQFRPAPERVAKTVARWRSWAFEASKQSRRSWFCSVAELASTADVVDLVRRAAATVVLHEEATRPLATADLPPNGDVVVVIGPEGGIAPSELDAFGVEPYRLGDTVLRTSTAGPAALAVLQSRTRWR